MDSDLQEFGKLNGLCIKQSRTKKTKTRICQMTQCNSLFCTEKNAKQDDKRLTAAEMSWLWRMAGNTTLQTIKTVPRKNPCSFSKDAPCGLAAWILCQLSDPTQHTKDMIQGKAEQRKNKTALD